MRLIVLLSLIVSFTMFGCKKSPVDPVLGKWKLVEVSEGDSSSTQVNHEEIVEFFSDGTVISNQSLCLAGDYPTSKASSGTYNSEEMQLIADCEDFGTVIRGFSIFENQMGIFGLCQNGYCMEIFEKI